MLFFPQVNEPDEIFDWQTDTFIRLSGSDISPLFIRNIGIWDMDSLDTLTITLPQLKGKSIDRIDLLIIKDDQLSAKDASYGDGISDVNIDYSTNTISITRKTGGVFDSTDYDDLSVNRGRIRLWT